MLRPLDAAILALCKIKCGGQQGGFGFGLAQVYFLVFVIVPMLRGRGEKAPQRPWEAAEGLEWEVPSPAPWHTFETPPKLDASATRVIG